MLLGVQITVTFLVHVFWWTYTLISVEYIPRSWTYWDTGRVYIQLWLMHSKIAASLHISPAACGNCACSTFLPTNAHLFYIPLFWWVHITCLLISLTIGFPSFQRLEEAKVGWASYRKWHFNGLWKLSWSVRYPSLWSYEKTMNKNFATQIACM